MIHVSLHALVLALLILAPLAHAADTAREKDNPTALDSYVHAEDDSYQWELVNTLERDGYKIHAIDLTSQTWRTEEEVSPSVWKHWLQVVEPDEVKQDTAFLYIGGGKNGGKAPRGVGKNFSDMAVNTGSFVAILNQTPNQPTTFAAEGRGRSEDSFIAYTWDHYLKTGDAGILARLPMTKGAVRAMDAIQEAAATDELGSETLNHFVVAGGSKRGWTTWTTAAVDTRVRAITPIVIDMLNLIPSFEHHWRALGFWAPAVGDYTRMGIMPWMGTPEYDALLEIVEPYSYRDRLTMPKLIFNSTGDQFFIPDSSQFYFDDLQGPTWMRYVPNTEHSMGGSDVFDTVHAFYQSVLDDFDMPTLTWDLPDVNTTVATPSAKPLEVNLWQAVNPEARDFRVDKIGRAYEATPVEANGDGSYTASVEEPAAGWKAFYLEFSFPGPGENPLKFTTPLRVTPEEMPHEYKRADPLPQGFITGAK